MKPFHLLSVVLFFCLLNGPYLSAQEQTEEAEIKQKLEQIKNRLEQLRNTLNDATGEEAKLLEELEAQDQRINKQGQLIITQQQNIDALQNQIDQLNLEIDGKNKSIQTQKAQITELLKFTLYLSHDRVLKLLLMDPNSDSAELSRHQIRYLQHTLYALIKEIAEDIILLQKSRSAVADQKVMLEEEKTQLTAAQDVLLQQKQERNLVLASLQKTIASYRSESESLAEDKSRLNNLLSEIQTLLDDLPEDLGNNIDFAKLKGTLIKPLIGSVIRSYRSLRSGQAKWDGIVIGNEAGKPVKAVAYGRVAFADWLRGYGLLIVIDHGDNYMTLYGHNQSILIEEGDWIQSGEQVATAGNSGNIKNSGVYFEIRKEATPTNPMSWFKK